MIMFIDTRYKSVTRRAWIDYPEFTRESVVTEDARQAIQTLILLYFVAQDDLSTGTVHAPGYDAKTALFFW